MKKKRYVRTSLCLAVGLLVLTGSAYANYDNANGYTMYKEGIKKMLTVENFSATVDTTLEHNGTTVVDGYKLEYQYDRNGNPSLYSKYTSTNPFVKTVTEESWIQDKKEITLYNGKEFNSYDAYSKGFNDDFLSANKEERNMMEKIIKFSELIADTFVGDLKNNFVLVSEEDGVQTYQIDLSGQQIPAYVNAGLGLKASSYLYQKDVPNFVDISDELDFDALSQEEQRALDAEAWKKLEQNGNKGIALINADHSITLYQTSEEYYKAVYGDEVVTDIFEEMGTDPVIDSGSCYVKFDKEGRIIENRIEGTMRGKDKSGKTNTLTFKWDIKLFDYGTTKIEPVDMTVKSEN